MLDFSKIIHEKCYEYVLISITSKHALDFLKLPDRKINGKQSLNVLISNQELAVNFFRSVDGKVQTILIDIEQKQEIDLYKIAIENVFESQVLLYKPNDITVDAADQIILNHFSTDLVGKNVLIYGAGNIGTKLAMRLAERRMNVFLDGRNKEKVNQIINALNLVLPRYSDYPIRSFTKIEKIDAVFSFVSSEKVIKEDLVLNLNKDGIAIDGGIGNFTEGFITGLIEQNIKLLRLDVRIGLPFLEASILANKNSFFQKVIGETCYNGINMVAGGIIGTEGSIIVDRINNPTQLIGVANGIGGVKDLDCLSDSEQFSLSIIQKKILSEPILNKERQ